MNNKQLDLDLETRINHMANTMNTVAQAMTQMAYGFQEINTYVKDSIQSKDSQIDRITELCGMKSTNVKTLTNQLKTHLTNQVGQKVTARDSLYKEVKNQLFYDFIKYGNSFVKSFKLGKQKLIYFIGKINYIGNTYAFHSCTVS